MRMLFFFMLTFALSAQSTFEFREIGSSSIELRENGRPVFVYNYGQMLANGAPEAKRRSSYLHPVYAPNGVVVTDDFPRDHWHHRGIFWAWPVVVVDGKRNDQWLALSPQTRFERWIEKSLTPVAAVIAVENGWYLSDRRIAGETVRILAHPALGSKRVLDLDLRFAATHSVIGLSGSPDGQKGYGGLSVRFAPRENTVIDTDSGRQAKDTDMVPHAWAELGADYGGKHAALRIDDDSSNPGAPNGWCLRTYGFLGVNFPGRQTFQLTPGKPLSLRYRITLSGK